MRRLSIALGLTSVAACATAGGPAEPMADARRPDAAVIDAPGTDGPGIDARPIDAAAIDARPIDAAAIDARPIDAAAIDASTVDASTVDAPPLVVTSLLLTELVLAPTGGELIEIVNPTAMAVDLSSYYLTDAPGYFKLPAGVAAVGADASDFVARFPAGAMLPAHGVATIAIDTAANFTVAYPGVTPTYSLASGTMMVLTSGAATLTNAGEPVVLFAWNGATDKVTDVDAMNAGSPTAANLLVAKTPVDGPDADTATTAYAVDALALPLQTAPGSGRSTKRLTLESAATEIQNGTGNGVLGHDETSEMTGTTWDGAAYTVPTPGLVPSALLP